MHFADVSNQDLLVHLQNVVRGERGLVAKVLAYLAEVEERRLHLELSYTSLHDFCTRKLGFSEDQACRRIAVARTCRRYPQLLDAVADGRLHLTGIDRLSPHLRDENVDEVIAAAAGKSRRDLDELIARLAPKPAVPDTIRVLPEQGTLTHPTAATSATRPACEPRPSRQLVPLAEELYAVSFTARRELRDKLENVRALMRHTNATGDLASIIEKAIDLLLASLEKQQRAKTKRPRAAKPSADAGYVTAETRREVHERDANQCAFVSADGERCQAREWLELDHAHARALGGTGEASNVRLLCRPHNQYAAEQTFGREHIAQKVAEARAKRKRKQPRAHEAATGHDAEPCERADEASSWRAATPKSGMSATSDDRLATASDALCGKNAEAEARRVGECPSMSTQGAPMRTPSSPKDPRSPREIARAALTGLGFRNSETNRALDALPAALWAEPLESIVRHALRRLT